MPAPRESVLRKLGRPALLSLAEALESDWLAAPIAPSDLGRHVPEKLEKAVGEELREMFADGMTVPHVARLLRAVADERSALQAVADRVELVWSGLEEPGSMTRDTPVVVQELFRGARKSVLVSSYVVDERQKAQVLFGPLAARMDEEPELSVRLFLNVQRQHRDQRPGSVLLREFAERFRDRVWPGRRLPLVFHDPRSLSLESRSRACLHAKCIVVDDERALISSANFTEAAHQRNIEAGLLIADGQVAAALRSQFETLLERNLLRRVPGL